jgi:hypothetical protein
MMRVVISTVVLFASASLASAMFAPTRTESGEMKSLTRPVPELTRASEAKRDLMITAETEIKVDGRVCGVDQVPAGAEVILIEVGSDRSVIRRIHFQSKK